MSDIVAKRIFISGRVQGVGYRAWTVGNANKLGLDGWVRNREDGRVEALLKGAADDVQAMIDACWDGSLSAKVEGVEILDAQGITPSGFVAKPTV